MKIIRPKPCSFYAQQHWPPLASVWTQPLPGATISYGQTREPATTPKGPIGHCPWIQQEDEHDSFHVAVRCPHLSSRLFQVCGLSTVSQLQPHPLQLLGGTGAGTPQSTWLRLPGGKWEEGRTDGSCFQPPAVSFQHQEKLLPPLLTPGAQAPGVPAPATPAGGHPPWQPLH